MTCSALAIDHVVLNVGSLDRAIAFYRELLGLQVVEFGNGQCAIQIGDQKIKLHPADTTAEPRSRHPMAGGGDICLLTDRPVGDIKTELETRGVPIIEGPVERTGALRPLLSIYLYDPDGNLIELANAMND